MYYLLFDQNVDLHNIYNELKLKNNTIEFIKIKNNKILQDCIVFKSLLNECDIDKEIKNILKTLEYDLDYQILSIKTRSRFILK